MGEVSRSKENLVLAICPTLMTLQVYIKTSLERNSKRPGDNKPAPSWAGGPISYLAQYSHLCADISC